MQQIADWLEKLGMSEYAERFAENGINVAALPHLTDQDLKDIGVLLGHRRIMLAAISKLAGVTPATPEPAAQAEPKPQDSAERRQVTVMFSDLVGSTALSTRMDPEDLREVISAYQKCVTEIVRRFGGFVAKYMGDGVLIYFGYPQAHEDDAERAVRAGLETVAAVAALKTPVALQTRLGIATGLVVVGDLIGSGASQEQAIVGETPNLAARLQGIAEPSSVVIAESTRKLVGSLFELQDLGAQDLKGITGPVQTWATLRPSSAESRFEAFHASGLTELVGREEEVEILLLREFQGKGAFITGGASGVGFALARAFGRANMRVMLADIEVGALNAALAELKGLGIDAHGIRCDVADRASVQHAAKETFAALGKVHLVCSNAGVGCGGPLELITPGDWDWVIGVNLMGFVHVIQAFLPRLKEQGEGGHILMTASVVGMFCTPGTGPYNAAKFGNVAVAETLAAELAGTAIGVSILCIGNVQTRIPDSARNRPERYGTATETSPEAYESLAAFVRLGQPPDEVAEKVMHAIMENELFVFTHPEFRNFVEERFQRILAAYPKPEETS